MNIDWFTHTNEREFKHYINENTPEGFTASFKRLTKQQHNIEINRLGRFRHVHIHNHDFFELSYVLKGSVRFIIDGNELTLQEGDFTIVNPYCYHESFAISEDDVVLNILLTKDFLPLVINLFQCESKLAKFITQGEYESKTNFLLFNLDSDPIIRSYAEELINLFNPEYTTDYNEARILIIRILTTLSQVEANINYRSQLDYDSQLVISTLNYMEINLKNANLKDIAKILNVSDYTLSKIFKNKMNATFRDTLLKLRLEKAHELITDTTLPISEIAYLIGYSNTSFFYNKFKQHFNQRPNSLRSIKTEDENT